MHLLIPGALPPPSVAPDLRAQVRQHCPALVQRLDTMQGTRQALLPEHTGCTPFEAIKLLQLGYEPATGMNLGAGLASLAAGVKAPSETVWLAELSAISIGREGAAFAHPASFQVTSAEADALFDSVSGLWAGCAISALPLNARQWRVWLNPEANTRSITPAAVADMKLSDWWPQDDSLRDWRRLLNEIQMVWHEHPINLARAERGEAPVNSLWLFGGASGWTPSTQQGQTPTVIYEGLHSPYLQGAWADWIAALPALSEYLAALGPESTLTLTGQQACVALTPARRRWWQFLLPTRPQNWNLWWNLPN